MPRPYTFTTKTDNVDFYLAAHMNAVQDAIADIDANGTKGAVTLTVAANTASDNLKARADYVCDGTDDHVQIQAAIDAAVAAGGHGCVRLSAGTFVIGAPIVLKTGISLVGQGMLTVVQAKAALNDNLVESAAVNDATMIDNVYLGHIKFDGNKVNQTDSESGVQGGTDKFGVNLNGIKNSIIDSIWVDATIHTGIYLAGPYNTIQRCRVTNVGVANTLSRSGIVVNYLATPHHRTRVLGCYVDNVREHGIKLYGDATDCVIAHNFVGVALDFGIWLEGCSSSTVEGNVVDGSTGVGIYIGSNATTNVSVVGNICRSILATNGGHGILINALTGGAVSGNTCHNNASQGIYLLNSSEVAVNGNATLDNGGTGLLEAGTSNYNAFVGNVSRGNTTNLTTAGANTIAASNMIAA